MTAAGDRPHLPLATEPLPFLRAEHVGRPVPVRVVEEGFALDEEPALRVHLAPSDTGVGGAPPPPRPPRPSTAGRGPLPATGAPLPVPLAVGALVAAWTLRRRRGPSG